MLDNLDFGGISTTTETVDGLRIRTARTQGKGGSPLLLLAPWPESLFAFAPIWEHLSSVSDLIAVDLPGFGQSESRGGIFSPNALADFVLKLIDDWKLGAIHAVGPDVGTAVLLTAAYKWPEIFHSITIGSGATSYPLETAGVLKDIIEAPSHEVFAAMPSRDVVGGALTGIEKYALPDTIREDYLSSYDGDRFMVSTQYVRTYPESLKQLSARLPKITTPTQVIAGKHDAFVPVSNAEYLHDKLPNSTLTVVDTGHFTWEDAPEYGRLVSDWITSGYRTASGN